MMMAQKYCYSVLFHLFNKTVVDILNENTTILLQVGANNLQFNIGEYLTTICSTVSNKEYRQCLHIDP